MAEAYGRGCKLYGVFSTGAQMQKAAAALEAALDRRGLVRDGDNLRLALHSGERHRPERPAGAAAFTAFHCSFSVASSPLPPDIPSFSLSNGLCGEAQAAWLRRLDRQSAFNAPQYFAEHAPPEKNILIRAGAGTGKTHTMISRVGYICYSQKVPLRQMARRIVMITFTNEAADQMAEKLKTYFRNCYLITGRAAYLDMVSQVDAMQISTIHAFARQLIGKLGTAFGYGAEPGIIAGDYHRRRKVSDMLDAYILQKEKACGGDFTQKLGMPVYAIRESILDFIGKLHSKNLDIGSIRAGDFGPLSPDDPHAALHELLAAVIPAAERACADQLRENNQIHLGSIMSVINRFMSAPENKARIRGLKEEETARQFLFVDEFQDTDDIQIETLLTLAALLDYRLFLVGDVKQCIYRFRGAKEKAFDRLGIEENPGEWLEYALQKNYRTDRALLQLFESSFAS